MMHNINPQLFPFQPHYFESSAGRMHYLDEGQGPVLLMVHGTPAWSFSYRHLVRELSQNYRCIAVDHLGFGLSDKPNEADYAPKAHAERLEELIAHLQLKNLSLLVHDFGGPIGLSYALQKPESVNKVIIFNTWLWSLNDYPDIVRGATIAGSWLGKLLYRYFNFSPKVLVKQAFYDKSKLTKEVHRHYTEVFPDAGSRSAPYAFARHLLASRDWYDQLWKQREVLQNKEVLVIWGQKDPLLPYAFLQRWKKTLPAAEFHELQAGHFVQEEKPEEAVSFIRQFLSKGVKEEQQ
jgi:haloalkane dehalogenase